MQSNEKLSLIDTMFLSLDRASSGMKDLSMDQSIPIYPLRLFGDYYGGFISDVTPSEIGGNVSLGIYIDGSIRTFKTVKYSDVRGSAKFHPGTIIRNDLIAINADRKIGITNIYGTHDFKNYTILSQNLVDNGRSFIKSTRRDEALFGIGECISVATQMQFFSSMMDFIEVSKGGLKVVFPTSPDASRDLLKMRDIPPDKMRRPMLINWIKEHTREVRSGPVTVAKHKRGVTRLKWMGYDVALHKNI